MQKPRSVMFLILVLALAMIVPMAAGAAPESNAVVTLAVDQPSFSTDRSVIIHVTIANPTDHPIKVLKWYTPAEDVEEPLFVVTRDGVPVSYVGAYYKRPEPKSEDYVTLKAGASITRDVDLAAYYDLSVTGNYAVRYEVSAVNLYSEKNAGPAKAVDSLTSKEVLVWIEGRQAAAAEAVSPEVVTGSTTFNKCTTTQQTTLLSARNQASVYSTDAKSYLAANKTGTRYTTWFGVYSAARYSTATAHFNAITSAMDTATVKFDCGCKKKYYAYVYPTQPYTIYLCSVYWTAPMTGTDSKAGTLIHEMSHFNVVAGTDDYVYGQAGAKSLAITNPDNAVNNADNHEYFAENTPALN